MIPSKLLNSTVVGQGVVGKEIENDREKRESER